MDSIITWFNILRKKVRLIVNPIPFAASKEWHFTPDQTVLRHKTNRFFQIMGMTFKSNYPNLSQIDLPIINQPEIGILGLFVKNTSLGPNFLFQVKAEPGNIGIIQLAPTMQATESNYSRVHGGSRQHFIEYFHGTTREVLHESLQTEQGWRFFRKSNNNKIVQLSKKIMLPEFYRWLDLNEIRTLLKGSFLINSDARSVLTCFFLNYAGYYRKYFPKSPFNSAVFASLKDNSMSADELMGWMLDFVNKIKLKYEIKTLDKLDDWEFLPNKISFYNKKKFYDLIQISVNTNCREVEHWDQPIIKSHQVQEIFLIGKILQGNLRFLVKLEPEPGLIRKIGLNTSLVINAEQSGESDKSISAWLKQNAQKAVKKISLKNSEEGGRFYQDVNLHTIYIFDKKLPDLELPANYKWLFLAGLRYFLNTENILTNELRSVLAIFFGLM